VEKSLQIANENGWIDESVLLFEHFSTFYSCKAEKDQHRARITEAIKNGAKLNFGVNIANRINNFCRDRDNALWYVMQWGLSRWTPAYLGKISGSEQLQPLLTTHSRRIELSRYYK
jgi:hypothetical protein